MPRVRNGNLLQYSCLENPKERFGRIIPKREENPMDCKETDTIEHTSIHTNCTEEEALHWVSLGRYLLGQILRRNKKGQ